MDKDFYMNDFERLLKDKTEEFKMYPSESVWTNIYNKLHPGKKWGIIGGSVLLLLFTASVLVLRTNNNTAAKKNSNPETNRHPQLSENISPQNTGGIFSVNNNEPNNNNTLNSITADNSRSNNPDNNLTLFPSNNSILVDNISRNSGIDIFNTNTDLNNISLLNSLEKNDNYSIGRYSSELTYVNSGTQAKANVPSGINVYVNANDYTKSIKKEASKKTSRFEWQLYFAPSVSYRSLFDDDHSTNLAYAYSNYIPGGIDKAVNHSPALGFELGNAVLYTVSKSIKVKAGLQLNYSRYNIRAYSTLYPELTTIRLRGNLNQQQVLQVASSYKNYGEYYQATTIGSQSVAISVPFGVDLKMAGTNKLSWYVSGSFQPTYILNNKSYFITNDLKNYVQNF